MKKFRIVERNYPRNFILDNIVDDDVQSIIFPLNLMQYMMFCPKYRIKNDLITPNSVITNLFSIIVTILFTLWFLYRNIMLYFFKDFMGVSAFTYFISYFDCLFYSTGFIMNYVTGIIHSKQYIKFVLTLQNVHRFLNTETNTRRSIIWNWITIVTYICGYIAVFFPTTILIFLYTNRPFYHIILKYIFMFFDFNVIYALLQLKILEYKVILWNEQALITREEDMYTRNYIKNMFQSYIDMLECYDIQKSCAQHFVSIFSINSCGIHYDAVSLFFKC